MTHRYDTHYLHLLAVVLIVGLIGLTLQSPAAAQRIVNVPQGAGTLNEAVDGDTTSTGARVDTNTVYVLERGGIYITDGEIQNAYPLTIVAAEGEGPRPRIIPGVAAGGEATGSFGPRGDLTLRGLYVTNRDELDGLQLRIIRIRENDVRVVIEDTHLDEASQAAFRVDGTGVSIFFRNSIVSNIGTTDSYDNGRGIDDRGNDMDSVVVENTTFYNLTSRALRDGGGLIKFAEFNHNTLVNIGQWAVTFGEAEKVRFTNNLVINGGFLGQDNPEWNLIGVDSLSDESVTQVVVIKNNNFYLDPALAAAYPDTIAVTPVFNAAAEAFVDASGLSDTNISEAIAFVNGPDVPAELVEAFYLDPGGPQPDMPTEGEPFDFSYPETTESYTASTAGQPLGDLTWFGMEIIPTAREADSEIPGALRLVGNYPNPFNPSTTIEFDLDQAAEVSLVVFDLLGRRVLALPAQQMQAGGGRTIHLNASSLPSGVYLYRLSALVQGETQVAGGRMMLIK